MVFSRCCPPPREIWNAKVLNYLAANARLSRKKQVGLVDKDKEVNDTASWVEELGDANMEDRDELAEMTELEIADVGTAFRDVMDKVDLKLKQLEDNLTDSFEVKVKNMKKDNEMMLVTSLTMVKEEMGKNSELTNTWMRGIAKMNKKIEDRVEELTELMNAMDDNIQNFDASVSDRLEGFEEGTECFIADFNFKFQALEEKAMRVFRRELEWELGRRFGDELKQKAAQAKGKPTGKENGICAANSGKGDGARGHNRKRVGDG